MAILNFSDVLKKVGLDPKEVKLIRHALSDKQFRGMLQGRYGARIHAASKSRFQQRVFLLDHFYQ